MYTHTLRYSSSQKRRNTSNTGRRSHLEFFAIGVVIQWNQYANIRQDI